MIFNRESFFKIYWQLEKKITPNLRYCQYFYEDTISGNINNDTTWLDLGCGHQLLPGWREIEEKKLYNTAREVVGLDYSAASLEKHRNITMKVCGDIINLPFKDSSFSLITANMVVEHLENPEAGFREIFRILKPGGKFIFHTPNVLGYITILARLIPEKVKGKIVYLLQGRKEEDVFPAYYKANSPKRILELTNKTEFTLETMRILASSAQFVIIPPLVILELFFIKLLMTRRFKNFRPYLLIILNKRLEEKSMV